MKLTPMDINSKEFKRGLRGYNPEEVDEFIDEVVENYEDLFKENSKLREKVASLTEQIEHFQKIEATIQNTLVLAQNAADQAKETSKRESELIVRNANETAQRIVDKAHNDVIQINDEFDRTKQEFIKFRAKFRNFIKTQLETFDDLERDVNKNFNIATPVEEKIEEKEIQLDESVFRNIEDDVLNEDIDEIKSFFASKDQ